MAWVLLLDRLGDVHPALMAYPNRSKTTINK